MIEIVKALLKILSVVLPEIFSRMNAAKEKKEKWEASESELKSALEASALKLRKDAANSWRQANDIQDKIDSDLKP